MLRRLFAAAAPRCPRRPLGRERARSDHGRVRTRDPGRGCPRDAAHHLGHEVARDHEAVRHRHRQGARVAGGGPGVPPTPGPGLPSRAGAGHGRVRPGAAADPVRPDGDPAGRPGGAGPGRGDPRGPGSRPGRERRPGPERRGARGPAGAGPRRGARGCAPEPSAGRSRVDVEYHSRTDLPLVGALFPDPDLHAHAVMRVER